MPSARVVWIEHSAFLGTDSNRHTTLVSSQQGDAAYGIKPTELFLISLASCTAVTFVQVMQKKRQSITGLEIEVEGTQSPDPPWGFQKIRMLYRVSGVGLDPQAVARSIELAEHKYCSVAASLNDQVQLETRYELLPA
ncbi:MAG: OsmC family protein [Anaerolineales bacterium]|nr:OsmC family protein [Anaerolineales bacterium]